MTDEERTLIDRAAIALEVSASQLVRSAALARARDVLNASANRAALLRLARGIGKHLVDPDVALIQQFPLEDLAADKSSYPAPGETHTDVYSPSKQPKVDFAWETWGADEFPMLTKVTFPDRPEKATRLEILDALRTAPTDFAEMLADAIEQAESGRQTYRAAVALGSEPSIVKEGEDDE